MLIRCQGDVAVGVKGVFDGCGRNEVADEVGVGVLVSVVVGSGVFVGVFICGGVSVGIGGRVSVSIGVGDAVGDGVTVKVSVIVGI